jgi:2OG-Fe(II) oxygenase superfamily
MARVSSATATKRLFPYDRWAASLPGLSRQYSQASPFPHIHLPNFLDADLALALAREFPVPDSVAWIQYKHYNENKTGLTKRELFPAAIGSVVDELNSPEFLSWLSALSGIAGLVADTTLEGGGLHQSARGGFLNMHADFTMHHHQKNWRRRVNLILYLNPNWRPEWKGAIELWDRPMRNCVVRVPPLLNHALIFSTNETSYHGFPEKLACPEGVSRKSLALYYYTPEADVRHPGRSTNYIPRPTDSRMKSALIWGDKKAVHIYSKAKEAFGIDDGAISKILGMFSRKR